MQDGIEVTGINRTYPKLWKLNPLERKTSQVLKIPALTEKFVVRKRTGVSDNQNSDAGDDQFCADTVHSS